MGDVSSQREQALKPPPERIYGRTRGHRLRTRQVRLLREALPRLTFAPAQADDPPTAFSVGVSTMWLEVGFGSGEHALAQIAAHPDIGLIACEVFENGICSLLSQLVPEGEERHAPLPPNLRLWPDDARVLLRQLPVGSLARVFLLFPDPWPKARHAKRRFVHPALLPTMARVMAPEAEWRIASDDPTYQAWVDAVMQGQTLFDETMRSVTRPPAWPPTRYEAKALREGRQPIYWRFRRRASRTGGMR